MYNVYVNVCFISVLLYYLYQKKIMFRFVLEASVTQQMNSERICCFDTIIQLFSADSVAGYTIAYINVCFIYIFLYYLYLSR